MTRAKPDRARGARQVLPIRVYPDSKQMVAGMAAVETGGNVSEMARVLLAEAIAARAAKADQ